MISSRLLTSGGCLRKLLALKNSTKLVQNSNASHTISYRVARTSHSAATKYGAELIGGAMWWWVLWHLWHESEHITGEFEYPDPSKWTNRELGIPDE